MIHAGANAGVYPLKDMAFESVDGFMRAGQSSVFKRLRLACLGALNLRRCDIDLDLLHS